MSPLEILTVIGLIPGLAALTYILVAKPVSGSPVIAAMFAAGFAAFTAVQIWNDGIMMFWTNHSANLTGIQVWWDLVFCVMIALFFIAPRAHKVNMNVPVWALFVATTASIGLFAMIARLFWLERQADGDAMAATKA